MMEGKEHLMRDEEAMQSFSATGQTYQTPSKNGMAMNAVAGVESWGAGPANLLPKRFTDESLIPVPVQRPEDIGKNQGHKTKKSIWSSRRKSENSNFLMKQMPRGEYLKHYAKDNDGRYVGTEEPANDCILRGDDIEKYRNGALTYEHDIGTRDAATSQVDGVVR